MNPLVKVDSIMYKQIMYIRQVTFLIMLCSSVMAFAQKAYLSVDGKSY